MLDDLSQFSLFACTFFLQPRLKLNGVDVGRCHLGVSELCFSYFPFSSIEEDKVVWVRLNIEYFEFRIFLNTRQIFC